MSMLAEYVLAQGLDHCQVLVCGSRGSLCELLLLFFSRELCRELKDVISRPLTTSASSILAVTKTFIAYFKLCVIKSSLKKTSGTSVFQ